MSHPNPLLDDELGADLLDACLNGDLERAQSILNGNSEIVNWGDPQRNITVLHTVAYHGLLQAVVMLLRNGADPNARNHNGEPPLFWAVRMNWFQVTLALLENGADANALDNSGSTALHYACINAVPEMIPLLFAFDCDSSIEDVDGKTALNVIEKEVEEDFIACTVLIRRQHRGMINRIGEFSNDPSFLSIDNSSVFETASIGSQVHHIPMSSRNKYQAIKKLPAPRHTEPKPSFVAGSKTYYLHSSSCQKLPHWKNKTLASHHHHSPIQNKNFKGTQQAELRDCKSAPSLGFRKSPNKSSSKSHMAKKHSSPPKSCSNNTEERRRKSLFSLTNDINTVDSEGNKSRELENSNKFLALDSQAIRRRLREFDPNNLGKYFEMPFVPDLAVCERFDVIISVEHCYNCHLHAASVRHDMKKYKSLADECLRKVLIDVMKNFGQLRVFALKSQSRASRIGALEVTVAMLLPSQNKNTSVDDWEWKCKPIHSKLASKSWPKLSKIGTQASDFVSEMLNTFSYAPLDELRDETPNDIAELEKEIDYHEKTNFLQSESYNFMKEPIRHDIMYVNDSMQDMKEILTLLSEKKDLRVVTRKEIELSYLRWVDRTFGTDSLSKTSTDGISVPSGSYLPASPNTDRRDFIFWCHGVQKHFMVYDGRLRVRHGDIAKESQKLQDPNRGSE